ncbi:uncharacterized protein MICPUCDRAFT_66370 [Micromonas pusilla CCMP1545]|uniref:Predicted protein n=1 Tax=Micromonas pusilla (strain CCMP1545) TaxID=564608 RepID=C1N8E1_MICPC|nr:uncharacterized protein MICPUCDRAFT_66370 [Micromonas pusilla CCMP1545]EEH51689.1 predicted protein [Micromonas pusilla CCMP1545]|eukprot:XP_003064067.1 predicted protein [Micromonas pusilla CCMP1545]
MTRFMIYIPSAGSLRGGDPRRGRGQLRGGDDRHPPPDVSIDDDAAGADVALLLELEQQQRGGVIERVRAVEREQRAAGVEPAQMPKRAAAFGQHAERLGSLEDGPSQRRRAAPLQVSGLIRERLRRLFPRRRPTR